MLFAVFLLLGLSAVRVCYETTEVLFIPNCTDKCLKVNGAILDGVCADNLKGICELDDGGVSSFFRRFGGCLSEKCPSDDDRDRFVKVFQEQCGWYSKITDTQAQYFGDWKAHLYNWKGKATVSSVSTGSTTYAKTSTTTQRVTSIVTVPTAITSSTGSTTRASDAVTVSAEPLSSSKPSSGTTTTTDDESTTISGDETSSVTRASTFTSSRSVTSAPLTSQPDKPVPSTATIAGIAVGGTVLLALIVAVAFFLLHRRKRNQSAVQPRSMSPPVYDSGNGTGVFEKAELNRQALEHQHPDVGVGAPVRYAELDADGLVSPVREAFVSVGSRTARVAQNF